MTSAERPRPTRERWQPLRIGVVELFHYDEQEWWFRDGRLLLRGNNGTGKSKVLALTLPFLLDGRVDGARVEPDGDRQKRMEWNLLLGEVHEHAERIGYSWLELGRLDAEGTAHHLTLGCGMKAVRGRAGVQQWLFLADRRVGVDLALTTPDRVPLTRDRLEDELEEDGRVFHPGVSGDGGFRARYRRAVDERLFGLGERRYDALVDLLLRVRQPQLSKRPDERALSRALTDALPPLDGALIDDVATAFRTLESDREHVRRAAAARDAAATYVDVYRGYARMAARRHAEGPRSAQSRVDDVGRRIARATEVRDAAREALREATERRDAARHEDDQLAARRRALDASDAAKSAEALDQAATRSREADERRAQATADAVRAEEMRARASVASEEARARAAATMAEATAAIESAVEVIAEAGIREAPRQALRSLRMPGDAAVDPDGDLGGDPDGDPTTPRDAADGGATLVDRIGRVRRDVDEAVVAHGRALALLREQLDDAAARDTELRSVVSRAADLESDHDDAREAARRTDVALVEAADAHVVAVRRVLEGFVELSVDDPEGVLERVDGWTRTLDGNDPLETAVADAALDAISMIDRERHAVDREHADATERLTALRADIVRLERGEDDEPPAPVHRDAEARSGRAGAPLWRMVEFADDLSVDDRAGLEAALHGAGLLDAWLAPDGALHGTRADGDTWILADGAAPAVPDVTAWLRPSAELDDEQRATVDRVLRRIGTDPGIAGDAGAHAASAPVSAVARDGRWRVGLLAGRWATLRAVYVGRAAREAARRARLAEARAEEQSVVGELDRLARRRRDLDDRRRRVDGERGERPELGPLRAAHDATKRAAESVRLTAEQLAEAAKARDAARNAVAAARDRVAATARDLGLPADDEAVAAHERALGELRPALAALWQIVRRAAEHVAATAASARGLADATSDAADRERRRAEAERVANDAAAYATQLQESVGVEVAELQAQRSTIDGRRTALRDEQAAAEAQRETANREDAAASAQLEGHQDALERETRDRAAAGERLWRFARTGVLSVARPEIDLPALEEPWSATAAVAVARRIEQAEQVSGAVTSDEAWQRALARTQDEVTPLADALSLSGDRVAVRSVDEGTFVVDVAFRGREVSIGELADELGRDVDHRRRLLDEKEREILENHLIDEVAATMQQRIGDAEQQVGRMNAELSARPTSTGMRLRLRWALADDAPAGLATARDRLMRQRSAVWSPEDREAVGAFLQAQIQALRADDPSRPWHEHLTQAFDYREWHRFVIERHQAGRWTSAAGPASGGERVLAATLPLFAAASAHAASAPNPHAPRLVLLDEAFAGVDDDARAKCLGLLAEFDLDVVMTSEREWGCYPEVPGLAIAQLSRVDGIDAILVTPWEWDGAVRSRGSLPEPPTARREELVTRPTSGDGTGDGAGSTDPDPNQSSLLDALEHP